MLVRKPGIEGIFESELKDVGEEDGDGENLLIRRIIY